MTTVRGAAPTVLLTSGPVLAAAGAVLGTGLAAAALLWPVAALLPWAVLALAAAGIALVLPPTVLFSAAVALQAFSGNWHLLGLPIGLDRLLVAATCFSLARRALQGRDAPVLRWRSVHVVLLVLAAVAVLSALWGGTLFTAAGAFALLDRLGMVPFLAFFLAPLLYRTRPQRDVLLVCLVTLGGYLGAVALLEGLGRADLAWPGFIADEQVGLHFGRARGPFLEAVANGLVLFHCAVASAVAFRTWRTGAARTSAAAVGVLCLAGTLFTLTRAVWLGTLIGTVAAMAVVPAMRRRLVPVLAAIATAVVLALALVPGLAEAAGSRSTDQRPLWDRYNTNMAALRIVEQSPAVGVGWQNFAEVGAEHLRQSDDYPLTGVGIEVHNVFLSHAAELGLPGAFLYVVALGGSVGAALLRRSPPELAPWRVGLVAVAASWLVVAMFGPLSYALPNTLLWLWAGLVLAPYLGADRYVGARA